MTTHTARTLTAREIDVLRRIAQGNDRQQTGFELGISTLTVKSHLQRIFRAIGATNSAHAVAICLRTGILPRDTAVPRRTHTPDKVKINDDGRKETTFSLKRACNGCGHLLGDLDNRDVTPTGGLADARHECDHCRPLVDLEAAGCRTFHLSPRNIAHVDREIDRDGIYAKGYWQMVNGKNTVTGLRIGTGENRLIAKFGDWIIRHPDSRWTIHHQPPQTTL
ncbi:response regulator transcription factor [Streptomyces sp. NPDC059015]|uniref:response regulator transcription factor n=1 Tax=unclassified Streptomyces TaxID=2593676 RepID=UPI00368D1D61